MSEPMKKILLVDDIGEQLVEVFNYEFKKENFHFALHEKLNAEEVLARLERDLDILVVLLDIMEDGEPKGISVLDAIRKKHNGKVQVIMISAADDPEKIVSTIKGGAFDYIAKDIYENLDQEDIRKQMLDKIMAASDLAEGIRAYKKLEKDGLTRYGDIIGESPPMNEVYRRIRLCAKKNVPVLVTGENGTGKELVAQCIHEESERTGRIIIRNIAALPRDGNLMQAELFGRADNALGRNEKGTSGDFRNADNGTLFLDEIGDAHWDVQTGLLRAVQFGEVSPVGQSEVIKADVRLIFGTNVDLKKAVYGEEKKFREDLYYRINVINIHLPPLREREKDILLLAHHFIEKLNKEEEKNLSLSNDDVQRLQEHKWPGNVRELENLILRSFVFTEKNDGFLELTDFEVQH